MSTCIVRIELAVMFMRYNNKGVPSQLSTLGVARGSAMCLNFNCMLVLLPICRNLVSYLRQSSTCCRRSIRRQLDKNIAFHKAVAYMIVFHTSLHVGAHYFNFDGYMDAYYSEEDTLASRLSSLPTHENGTWLNPIRSVNESLPFGLGLVEVLFVTVAGVTGVLMTLSLIVMTTSSTALFRRSYFEVFWFTHHLFIIFFACLIFHGFEGIVRGQTNVDEHNPEQCYDQPWGPNEVCPDPQFAGSTPTCCRRSIRRQLDKNIAFHKAVAYMIVFHTSLHVGAHYFNFDGYMDAYYSEEDTLAFRLSSLPTHENGTWLNPIRKVNEALPFGLGLVEIAFITASGVTGVVVTIVLIVMVTSSTELISNAFTLSDSDLNDDASLKEVNIYNIRKLGEQTSYL
ncbi:NADPH oxidase 1-like, partial [Saccoglossus kowalevskii]